MKRDIAENLAGECPFEGLESCTPALTYPIFERPIHSSLSMLHSSSSTSRKEGVTVISKHTRCPVQIHGDLRQFAIFSCADVGGFVLLFEDVEHHSASRSDRGL